MSERKEDLRITSFYVGGMACAFCASTIEKGLSRKGGVKSVKVILESSEVFVRYDQNLVNVETLRKEIEKLGYYVFEKKLNTPYILKDSKRRALNSWIMTILSLLLTLPIMFKLYTLPQYTIYINFIITSLNLFYFALPIQLGALNAIRKGILNEHVLYGVAGISAYILGIFGILNGKFMEFLFISSLLTSLHLTAGWMGSLLTYKAERSLSKVIELRPLMAHLINGIDIPVNQLKSGDVVIVKPGEKIPLDGVVIDGESEVSEAIISGESEPILKKKGDFVIGGSTNGSGYLIVKVTNDYSNSYISRILGLTSVAKESKTRTLSFFDKVVDRVWVPLVLLIAILTFLGWLVYGIIINRALWINGIIDSLLVMTIGYPCAIGFSVPSIGLSLFQKYLDSGVLIKNHNSIEKLKDLKIIVLDKTGTLTFGFPVVKGFHGSYEGLMYAASLERFSSHPIARAIFKYAEERGVSLKDVKDFKEIPGKGVIGIIDNNEVFVGRSENNRITVYRNEEILAEFDVEDSIREGVKEFIQYLKNNAFRVLILSGDKEDKVKEIADNVGINEYYANLSPEGKIRLIEKIRSETNGKILMVGDGINDTAALSLSDISIVTGNGVDISKNVADMILINNNMETLKRIIQKRKILSKAYAINILIALGYNAIGIPLAITGVLTAFVAMNIMILSLLSIFLNAVLARIYA